MDVGRGESHAFLGLAVFRSRVFENLKAARAEFLCLRHICLEVFGYNFTARGSSRCRVFSPTVALQIPAQSAAAARVYSMQQSQEPDDAPREECATAAPSPLSPYVSAQKHEDEAEQSTQQEQQRPSKSRFDEYLDHPPSCTLWPQDRIECSMCGKRGRFYCPYCVAFVGKPDGVEVPEQLRLPLQVCFIC